MSQQASPTDPPPAAQSTDLVPVAVPGGMVPYSPVAEGMQFWANWKLQGRDDRRRLMKSFQESDMRANDVIGQPIDVTHVLVHPVDIIREDTGEVVSCHRTVLHLADHSTVAFVSNGILKALSLVCMMEGMGPWSPPLRMKVKQLSLKNARRTYTLEIVEDGTNDTPRRKR